MKLARHTAFNLIGLGLPLLGALMVIPSLVAGLGASRFGVLTLIWAVTSYFGLFDLGIGRALTQSLAVCQARGDRHEVPRLTRTGLQLMALLGVLGGVCLAVLAPWGAKQLGGVPETNDWVAGCGWMAFALPAITLTAGLRGMLEAVAAFGWINAIRLPMGLLTYLGPWAVLVLHGPDLVAMTAVLAVGRWVALAAHVWIVRREVADVAFVGPWCQAWLPRLLRAGGWLTLSNVVSPFMGYVDRFVVGVLVSAAAVAHYATPQEMVTKLWIVPGAVMAVLLPRFAASGLSAWPLMRRSAEVLFWVLLPVCSGLAVFAPDLMRWWIGPEFAHDSAPLLQVFAVGIWINCTAHVPLTWLHGQGAYRAPALLHLAELPLFMLTLLVLTAWIGPMGAAAAWLLRMVGDTAALFLLASRQAEQPWQGWVRMVFAGLAIGALPCAAIGLPEAWTGARMVAWLLGLLAAATIARSRLPRLVRDAQPAIA